MCMASDSDLPSKHTTKSSHREFIDDVGHLLQTVGQYNASLINPSSTTQASNSSSYNSNDMDLATEAAELCEFLSFLFLLVAMLCLMFRLGVVYAVRHLRRQKDIVLAAVKTIPAPTAGKSDGGKGKGKASAGKPDAGTDASIELP